MNRFKEIAFVLLLCELAVPAWAARPFVTDDARLTSAQSCQLESWMRNYPGSREWWALPACNPYGNFEVTLGIGTASNAGQSTTHDYVLQAKTLFRPLATNDWGWGLAAGTVRHPEIHPGPNLLGNSYSYLPFSISLKDNEIVLHGNLGWLRDRATKQDNMTWGIGGEFRLAPRFVAIAETFGDNRNQPYWQLGGRFAVIPDRVQIDATIGQQFSGPSDGRWLSIGLRLTPEHLF